MLFLADESCDFAVVLALRAAGHEVVAIAEEAPGLTDREVMTRAESEQRVVITEDKDFGQLVFSSVHPAVGCLLLRYPATARGSMAADIVALVEQMGPRLAAHFVTAEPGRTRITRLPPAG